MKPDTGETETALALALGRLQAALARGGSGDACLRLWSRFVRCRDGNRCVVCDASQRTAAHHICRKAFMPDARFQTGNGATLCRNCHREAHEGFNGRPDLQDPMDARGGEKIEAMAQLYAMLADDSDRRGAPESWYFLSDNVLARFLVAQGFSPESSVAGSRIRQAATIWQSAPVQIITALLGANL